MKKKLLIILGAGSSVEQRVPSVRDIDEQIAIGLGNRLLGPLVRTTSACLRLRSRNISGSLLDPDNCLHPDIALSWEDSLVDRIVKRALFATRVD